MSHESQDLQYSHELSTVLYLKFFCSLFIQLDPSYYSIPISLLWLHNTKAFFHSKKEIEVFIMIATHTVTFLFAFASQLAISKAFVLPLQTCKTCSSLQSSLLPPDIAMDGKENNGQIIEHILHEPEVEATRRFFITTAAIAASSVLLSSDPANAETIAASAKQPPSAKQILRQSAKKAISGGKAGATASIFQVLSLMWLRTSMNYQYRYGGTLGSSLSNLYEEGGVGRLYQGLPFALIQGPLTRFGDTVSFSSGNAIFGTYFV